MELPGMKPLNLVADLSLDRRLFLALGLSLCCGCAATLSGCATPLWRGQSPEGELPLDEEKKLEMVGDYARPSGLNWTKLEAVALVTGLDNTGSDPPNSPQRQMLLNEMMSHDVRQAERVLASPTTSMVILRAYLPPGVQKGDTFDVEVRIPSRSETASIRGGWLMPSRMRQMEVMGGSVMTGSIDGLAQGDVLVDAIFDGNTDKTHETRGRVLSGGISATQRKLGLGISRDDASVRISTLIGKAINQRFYTIDAGVKQGVAEPQRDNFLELAIAPRYKHNLARYLRVIRNIPLKETPVERVARIQLLERKLQEPASAALAAIQLEAIGNEAVPALKKGLTAPDLEARFYAAEALAYLDQPEAAAPLAEVAEAESAFRWHALTALAAISHVAALDALNDLLHVKSIETRYGAFRAMKIRNPEDPAIKGELLEKRFRYHAIATSGEPLIHVTRTRLPEIVVFGHDQRVKPPASGIFAGKQIMVTSLANGDLKIGRFAPGADTVYETCPPQLDLMIRTLVKLGAGYAEVVQCLQEAQQAGCLECRVAVEAVPRPDRKYYKSDDPLPEAPTEEPAPGTSQTSAQPASGSEAAASGTGAANTSQQLANRRASTPVPELFQDGIETRSGQEKSQPKSNASEGETYVDPNYRPQKPGFFDRLNPFSK
jgi:flagellar basal body P-ring protein FlgI